MNKETEDALHTLLHCSLKDTEYETQFEQYKIVRDYIINLQQENKQLKEELENIKDFNNKLQASKDRLDKDDYNLAHILTELEEWLKYQFEHTLQQNNYHSVLDEIKELKEKYK